MFLSRWEHAHMKRIAAFSLLLLIPLGCTRLEQPAESYHVVAHDRSSGDWVLISGITENPNRVQIRMACDFYKRGDNEAVKGPDSCDLVVGETLVPNRFPGNRRDFLDVQQGGDKLFVIRDDGADRVHQQFSIRAVQALQR